MRLVDAAKPMFARHETFHPRYGWFRKACSVVASDPGVFARVDAPVRIGVGKNMVRAIRFWGLAAKLIKEDPQSPNRRSPGFIRTRLGESLFGDCGWDQYMEDPGTLWLLHWLLLEPPSRLPVWWLAFNEFDAVEFTDDQLEAAIRLELDGAAAEWPTPHLSSIKKDVSALLRTYAPAEQLGRTGIDDILDCPLRELNLIRRSAATSGYRFNVGLKPTLPPAILAYASLKYINCTRIRGNTATISHLTHERGAPGRVFKLNESEMHMALELAFDSAEELTLTATTGAIQISWTGEPREIADAILSRYYGCSTSGVGVGHDDARLPIAASVKEQ